MAIETPTQARLEVLLRKYLGAFGTPEAARAAAQELHDEFLAPLMESAPIPQLDGFDGWIDEKEAAKAIRKTVRTMRAWRRRGSGPPYALFGRTIRYRKSTLIKHYRQREITPTRER